MARAKINNNNQTAKAKSGGKKKAARKGQQLNKVEADPAAWLPAPGNLVRRFRDEVDRLFQEFGFDNVTRSLPNVETLGLGVWAPAVEVFERDGHLVVHADLPGLTSDDITIDLTERAVTIEGERKQQHEENENGYYRSERSYGRFSRRIPLPEGIDIETAAAQFRDGVLEISLGAPEPRARKAKKIAIGNTPSSTRVKAAGR